MEYVLCTYVIFDVTRALELILSLLFLISPDLSPSIFRFSSLNFSLILSLIAQLRSILSLLPLISPDLLPLISQSSPPTFSSFLNSR